MLENVVEKKEKDFALACVKISVSMKTSTK